MVAELAASPRVDNISKEMKGCTRTRKFTWGDGFRRKIDLSGRFIKDQAELLPCCTDAKLEGSEIQRFFANSDVLITGATGFMGKILIEKLLVSCPNIGNVYLLIREKKGKTFDERFDLLFQENVFVRLHKLVPNFRKKVIAVAGDCSRPRLGLSDTDYEMLNKKVSVIFHGAATVRFDEKLKMAANINVRGVKEMLQFARKCTSLKSMVHISTAYANCTTDNHEIKEEFYPPAHDYQQLLDIVDNESDADVENMTSDFIKPWPNTYAFTKQIGEQVVQTQGQDLPLGIFRPAIVIATYKEPVRGWSDNIYGPTGVITGAGTGVLRVVQSREDNIANVVPVDMAVNGVIAAAWRIALNYQNGDRNIDIFNYVSSERNPVRWGEFSYWNGLYGHNWPTVLAIWYATFTQVQSRFLYLVLAFFLHTIPAYLADAALIVCRKEPRMRKAYAKIAKFCDVMAYFSVREWRFPDSNVSNLWKSLSAKDQAIYPFDIEDLNWDYYAQAHLLGLRVYLVKDDIDTLPQGRTRWRRLHILHRSVQAVLVVFITWLAIRLLSFFLH